MAREAEAFGVQIDAPVADFRVLEKSVPEQFDVLLSADNALPGECTRSWRKKIWRHWQLYLIIALPTAFLVTFNYVPMLGIQIAFRNYNPVQGMWGSDWVDMKQLNLYFDSPYFWPVFRHGRRLRHLGPAPRLLLPLRLVRRLAGDLLQRHHLPGFAGERKSRAVRGGADRRGFPAAKMFQIDLPTIRPTIIVLLVLSIGGLMSVGFEKVFLLQNNLNISASEVTSTYVYKIGLVNTNYSFAVAVGLFNSVLIFIANTFARKQSDSSLF